MSVQIFLQGHLFGIEDFLTLPAPTGEAAWGVCGENLIIGRARWASLLTEVLPRALLAELGLPKALLGSSGGRQFLLILPGEAREAAGELLDKAAAEIEELSGRALKLLWSATENLGDWAVVRRRLREGFESRLHHPAAGAAPDFFEPFVENGEPGAGSDYFVAAFGAGFGDAKSVGWSPETPGRVLPGEGKHQWPLTDSREAIPLARHTAPADGAGIADPPSLAARAEGRKAWGVLRGDVDNFEFRIRRLTTIEEHVKLSLLYRRFFAGELEVLCSLPDFWRKVSIIYTGGNDFAVFGAWDALIALAREVQRLFHRFNEENLKEIPGAEGKTISMALAMAPEPETPLTEVFREAGRRLEYAKAAGRDCFHVFGHLVEWRQLAQAAELHENLERLVTEFGGSPSLLGDLIRFYRRAGTAVGTAAEGRFNRPWRYHRRLSLVAAGARDREYQRLRSRLVADLIGKSAAQAKLRPGGRVALEWARLLSEE